MSDNVLSQFKQAEEAELLPGKPAGGGLLHGDELPGGIVGEVQNQPPVVFLVEADHVLIPDAVPDDGFLEIMGRGFHAVLACSLCCFGGKGFGPVTGRS